MAEKLSTDKVAIIFIFLPLMDVIRAPSIVSTKDTNITMGRI